MKQDVLDLFEGDIAGIDGLDILNGHEVNLVLKLLIKFCFGLTILVLSDRSQKMRLCTKRCFGQMR